MVNLKENWTDLGIRKPLLGLAIIFCLVVPTGTLLAQSQETRPTKYWIFFRENAVVDNALLDKLRETGVLPVHQSDWLHAISAFIPQRKMASVASFPSVDRITPVARSKFVAIETPSNTFERIAAARHRAPPYLRGSAFSDYGSSQVQLELANVLPNLRQGINGSGVLLGIIDTGIGDLDHSAFDLMKSEGRFLGSRDFTGQPDDGNRHAQWVLSVAAGNLDGYIVGPANGARVLHARTEVVTSETRQEEDNLVAALEWMTAQDVDVINISLSYTEFDLGEGDYDYADMNGLTAIGTLAVDKAVQNGVVVVVAAGNEASFPGEPTPCPPDKCWYYIGSPADAFDAITVGATTDDDEKAVFSSFGPTYDGRTKPEISAMGQDITYARKSISTGCDGVVCINGAGTSFSAPMVAGIVAQMLQVNSTLTPLEVREIIQQTARIPDTGNASRAEYPNDSLGWGIVDAAAAVAMATSTTEDPEIPDGIRVSEPFPNPATDRVQFVVSGNKNRSKITTEIFDLLGRRVSYNEISPSSAGTRRITIGTNALTPGVYIFRVSNFNVLKTGKIVIVR